MRITFEQLWYGKHLLRWILWPFAFFYGVVISLRRIFLVCFFQKQFPVPIIVVGNLTVGGVGKTPLVIELAKQLQAKGLRVGIVSRGYRARIKCFPHQVSCHDSAEMVGDEPLLLARKTNCPVVIAPKRTKAVQYLLNTHQSQIIISDDGLQHYRMGRAIEIVVIDGVRKLGNGLCLPAGPLREYARRLRKVDLIVVNGGQWPGGHSMDIQPGALTHLMTGQMVTVACLEFPIAAVAGIGHPQRFFTTLQHMGIVFKPYSFPDHHLFQSDELQFREKTIIMTEKDAVKCQAFAEDSWYFLPIEARLTDSFWSVFWSHDKLRGVVF